MRLKADDLSSPRPVPTPDAAAAPAPLAAASTAPRRRRYLPVRAKFSLALAAALAWGILSYGIATPWIAALALHIGSGAAHLVIFGIALLPGFMNAFMVSSLLLDHRPAFKHRPATLPALTILVAAYNEQNSIEDTLESIALQDYPGELSVVVINDGSTDGTAAILERLRPRYAWLRVIHLARNAGKSAALNAGLRTVDTPYVITVDGDSYLFRHALENLVLRLLGDPAHTAAVAGAVMVRNSRANLVAKIQEWDYFHGIAAVKRIQSLYQGTLVAQGAFSIYRSDALRQVGGWRPVVGEDIVLTWALLEAGYRVGYSENACLFTNAPATWGQFIRQRQRWSRGLIEAFKSHWRLLFKPRLSSLFVWWNATFPYLDLVYTFVFLPGIVLALFGHYYIAGPMTLIVLPLAMLVNYVMFRVQVRMFQEQGLKVRKNVAGFVLYALFYSLVLQPACVIGYLKEVVLRSKNWGTK